MKYFGSSASIHASPESVWAIITDGPGLTKWDSVIEKVEGEIKPGRTIKLFVKVNPGRAFPLKVTTFEPGRKLVFSGGMPLGLFRGVRTYTLTPQATGGTGFHMREDYTGPLLPMIWSSIPDLGPSFQQYADGLKRKAEEPAPA